MPGIAGRMSTVIKAKVSRLLDRAEDPSETLEYSYQKQIELLQNVKKGIADVVTSKKRLQLQSQKLEQSVVKLDTQARQALSAGNEELARTALERKQVAQTELQSLDQQRVQQVIADVATEIEAARLLVWRAAWMGRNGIPMTGGQGSMSKLKAGDVAMWATTALMDLVGPEASLADHPLEKFFRDAKIYQLFEGTAQVQRLVVSRMQVEERKRQLAEAAEVISDLAEREKSAAAA